MNGPLGPSGAHSSPRVTEPHSPVGVLIGADDLESRRREPCVTATSAGEIHPRCPASIGNLRFWTPAACQSLVEWRGIGGSERKHLWMDGDFRVMHINRIDFGMVYGTVTDLKM